MITFLFFLAIAVLMGLAVLLWDSSGLGTPASVAQYERFLDRDPMRLAHLGRIMGPQDRDFLRSIEGAEGFADRLDRNRRRVLRYTIADLQEEFHALMAVGVMLASSSTARRDSFGIKLVLRAARFHLMCWILRGLSYVPAWNVPGRNASWALMQVQSLRTTTRELLAALSNSDMDDLRNQIMND